ncbi:MAG: hypothetical protein MR902_01575 [Campylobacter sp.]|nr:hypothetical protein [Campylobacter sp.]
MHGRKVELSYDMGEFYVNLVYAKQNTNQPTSITDASSCLDTSRIQSNEQQGYVLSKVTMLPKDYGSVDMRFRFLDEKLTIGTTAKYYGKSKRAFYSKKANSFVEVGEGEVVSGCIEGKILKTN